jgi:hypothetical protein
MLLYFKFVKIAAYPLVTVSLMLLAYESELAHVRIQRPIRLVCVRHIKGYDRVGFLLYWHARSVALEAVELPVVASVYDYPFAFITLFQITESRKRLANLHRLNPMSGYQ